MWYLAIFGGRRRDWRRRVVKEDRFIVVWGEKRGICHMVLSGLVVGKKVVLGSCWGGCSLYILGLSEIDR